MRRRKAAEFRNAFEKRYEDFLVGKGILSRKEIEEFKEKAVSKYGEASDILHGKLPKPSTEDESLKFIKEVFFIIESLYSEQKRV